MMLHSAKKFINLYLLCVKSIFGSTHRLSLSFAFGAASKIAVRCLWILSAECPYRHTRKNLFIPRSASRPAHNIFINRHKARTLIYTHTRICTVERTAWKRASVSTHGASFDSYIPSLRAVNKRGSDKKRGKANT